MLHIDNIKNGVCLDCYPLGRPMTKQELIAKHNEKVKMAKKLEREKVAIALIVIIAFIIFLIIAINEVLAVRDMVLFSN